MGLVSYARRELEESGYFDKDSDYGGLIGKAVMEIVEVFEKQNHSGMSAGIVTSMLNKLLRFEPLFPVVGSDDEWEDLGDSLFQNRRLSSVFKDKEGKPYYIDAVIFTDEQGISFASNSVKDKNGNNVSSKQYIKFPFTPKTYYLDVVEDENGDHIIKDMDALREVLSKFE